MDDDPSICDTLTTMLQFRGYRTSVARTGKEAIDIAHNHPPDLVLLDVMMPGMDGIEALRALRRIPRLADTPVVFLTARVQPSDVARYQELGSLGLIRKPFEPVALVDTIGRIWSRYTVGAPSRACRR